MGYGKHTKFILTPVFEILKDCVNATKGIGTGIETYPLCDYIMQTTFLKMTGASEQKLKCILWEIATNDYTFRYEFLRPQTNWLRFTSLLAADIVNNDLKDLTDDNRKNVFIIDDSLFNRTSCKKTELASKVFDHTDMHFKKGFRMLTLSWSDGNTLIPVNSCLLASAKDTNIIGPVKDFDNRTIAGKRRMLAQTKAPEAMMTLLDTALSAWCVWLLRYTGRWSLRLHRRPLLWRRSHPR